MSPAKLHVSSIKQAGYAKIDEQGTEAGVVTGELILTIRFLYRLDLQFAILQFDLTIRLNA